MINYPIKEQSIILGMFIDHNLHCPTFDGETVKFLLSEQWGIRAQVIGEMIEEIDEVVKQW